MGGRKAGYCQAGFDLRLIQEYLGHSSVQTTTTYLHLTSKGKEHVIQTTAPAPAGMTA